MPRKRSEPGDEERKISHYTIPLDDDQMEKLKGYCDYHLWEFFDVDYARFAFKNKARKVTLVGYKSGKLVVSGKGTEDFVRDVIEAEITGEPKLGYDEVHNPEWFEPHAGVDEAGKGDFFGPVVSACVIADGDMVRAWAKAGVKDSKSLGDATILALEKKIRKTDGVVVETSWCGMEKYNELMARPRANLNSLLAWLHAKSIQNALSKRPVDHGMLDQFSKAPLVQRQLKKDGVKFDLKMRTRAESDPVVAAASICARAEFVRQIQKLSEASGIALMKGASAAVKEQGRKIVENEGRDALARYAKLHFRTAYEVLGLPVPPRIVWKTRAGA